MTRAGEPTVVADFPAAVTWDGKRLPVPRLVLRAAQLVQGVELHPSILPALQPWATKLHVALP